MELKKTHGNMILGHSTTFLDSVPWMMGRNNGSITRTMAVFHKPGPRTFWFGPVKHYQCMTGPENDDLFIPAYTCLCSYLLIPSYAILYYLGPVHVHEPWRWQPQKGLNNGSKTKTNTITQYEKKTNGGADIHLTGLNIYYLLKTCMFDV